MCIKQLNIMRYCGPGPNNSYKPITNTEWVRSWLCKLQKGCTDCTRLAAASDKVYQLEFLAHGWWFSPGNPASSTTKTGLHDIAEIFLKVALFPLSTINQINQIKYYEILNRLDNQYIQKIKLSTNKTGIHCM